MLLSRLRNLHQRGSRKIGRGMGDSKEALSSKNESSPLEPHWVHFRADPRPRSSWPIHSKFSSNFVDLLWKGNIFSYQSFACLFYLCFVVSCIFLKIDRQMKWTNIKLNEFGGGEDLGGVGKKEKHDQNILYRKKFNRFVYAITQIETIICILKSEGERMLQCAGRFQERGNVGVHLRAE